MSLSLKIVALCFALCFGWLFSSGVVAAEEIRNTIVLKSTDIRDGGSVRVAILSTDRLVFSQCMTGEGGEVCNVIGRSQGYEIVEISERLANLKFKGIARGSAMLALPVLGAVIGSTVPYLYFMRNRRVGDLLPDINSILKAYGFSIVGLLVAQRSVLVEAT